MKVLFVGLGSIGQRHLRNLRSVLGDRLEPMACRSTDRDSVIVDGKIQAGFSLSREYGLKNFHDLDTALRAKPEMVFVTNPSSLHMPVALKAAAAGCHLFLEKPISHHLDGVKELAEIVRRQKVTVMVGYQMRFHPGYQELRQLLRQGQYGKVIAANFSWGTYLPSHHPYEDYRRGYAARRDLGGGVVLGLIHDIDMICDLFGQPLEVEAQGGRLSSLEIDVEDTVEAVMRFQGDAKEFPVNLFLSYARTKEQHQVRVQLEQATVLLDFTEGRLTVVGTDGREIRAVDYREVKRNDLFVAEIKEFLNAVSEGRDPVVCLQDGVESLTLALRIKEACGEKCH